MFSLTRGQLVTVVIAAVIFISSVFFGTRSGLSRARTNVVLENTQKLVAGLQFFRADQNRYPSDQEFADQNIMRSYFTPFPAPPVPSVPCSGSYFYHNTGFQTYQLSFCLATVSGQYKVGWNTYNKQ